jgi:glycosyltransferase involved in cell wall biosynthesis
MVSEECNGIVGGGGIGACVRGLSELWSSTGLHVDILITNLTSRNEAVLGRDIRFVNQVYFLPDVVAEDKGVFAPVDEPSKSYCVYRFLRERDYTEVHFNDWLGTGFYTAMARRQGLFDATVVTHLHGSSEWVRGYNLNPPELEGLETEAIERSQIENSDVVISPSRYLLDWCAERGLKLPVQIRRQWVLPQWNSPQYQALESPLRTRPIAPGVIQQIIYFGRQERRKGFDLFVDAIAKLPDEWRPDITFVGRFDRIEREYTGSRALRKLRDYPGRLTFFHDLGQKDALGLLRRATGALCVMPSLIENSPCVIGECFTLGIPFLITDVGGSAELIDEASRADCMVGPDASELSRAIVRVMRDGMPPIVSTLSPDSIRSQWLGPILPATEPVSRVDVAAPLVSVCFTHYERPHLLARALDAILIQTYDNIEIIVVDDGSRTEGAKAYLDEIESRRTRFPITVIRSENRYLGAARNTGARQAKGEFLLFHDDDNFAEPREVEIFVAAASRSRADILTAQCYVFHDGALAEKDAPKRVEYYPLGIGGVFSFFRNRFGDANALVRRATFERLGGYTEERGVGWEDWELFLKAHLSGARMGVVPEPLFNYRASGTGMLGTGNPTLNHERLFAAIDACRPSIGSDLVRYASRHQISTETLDRTWHLLAREPAGARHQHLTSVEPNSRDAIVLLSELAFELGRFEDAIGIGGRIFDQREKMAALLQHSPSMTRKRRKPFELVVAPPKPARDAIIMEGWMVGAKGAPVDPSRVRVNGRWFAVMKVARLDRPDVRTALGLPSDEGLGFVLYAVSPDANSAARPGIARAGGLPGFGRLVRGGGGSVLSGVDFVFDDISINLPAIRGGRGHVDKAGWRREVSLTLPPDRLTDVELEIETAVAAETAVIWGDGEIEFGRKQSSSRRKYARAGAAPDEKGEFRAVVPTNIRTHVIVS